MNMTDDLNNISLNLKRAPVVIGLSALDSNSRLKIAWPDRLDFVRLSLPKEDAALVKEKLNWIKRQYDTLVRNDSSRPFAPHVVPYLALADLNVRGAKTEFSSSLDSLRHYPLEYTKNLLKSLGNSPLPRRKTDSSSFAGEAAGPAIEDRARFRVISRWPLNELEAGFMKYYEDSGLAYAAAFDRWQELDYEAKLKLLQTAINTKRAEPIYRLEVVLEPQLLLDAAEAGWFKVKAIQAPTPVHGYVLPSKLADGGMLERCFDISYELHSRLSQSAPKVAPLVCLWGHRQRALIDIDLAGLRSMARPAKKRLGLVSRALLEKLSELHPTIVEQINQP